MLKSIRFQVFILLKIALSQVLDKLTDSISPIFIASSTSAGTIRPPKNILSLVTTLNLIFGKDKTKNSYTEYLLDNALNNLVGCIIQKRLYVLT